MFVVDNEASRASVSIRLPTYALCSEIHAAAYHVKVITTVRLSSLGLPKAANNPIGFDGGACSPGFGMTPSILTLVLFEMLLGLLILRVSCA